MTNAVNIPKSLGDLKALFDQQIAANAQIHIDGASLGITGLDDLLNKTLGGGLVVSNANLSLTSTQLTVSGVISFLDSGFHISLGFILANGKIQVSIDAIQVDGTALSLNRLVVRLVPTLPSLPTEVPDLSVASLHFSLDSSKTSFLFSGATATPWQIPLGVRKPSVQASILITQDGANLTGALAIGTASFGITLHLEKNNTVLTGVWQDSAHPLGWDSIVSALGLPASLDIPSNIPNLGFQAAKLTLDLSNQTFTLTGLTAQGAAFFSAGKGSNGAWGFTFGAAVASGWQFSQISGGLKTFDFLSFQNAYLLISSIQKDKFVFPDFPPMSGNPIDAVPGLNFGASVNLAGGTSSLAKAVYKVAGVSTANIDGRIGSKLVNTQLSASLGGSLLIPPTNNLRLTNPALVLLAEPPTVEVEGTLEIQLQKQVIDVTGRLAINPEKASFTVDVESQGKSLLAPFGFTGVSLEEIGVSLGIVFTPPGVDLALEGVFRIGDTPSDKCAIEFSVLDQGPAVEVNPILFYGQFSSLSFATVFGAVAPKLTLPPLLKSIGLKNVFVFYAEQSTTLPDNSSVAPGFAIQGELDAFNFIMQAALKIDFDSGVSGSAAMTPIRLGNGALEITGNGSLGGAELLFNTLASPFLFLTFNAKLLDIASTQINGSITDSGFSFGLVLDVPSVMHETIQCTFQDYTNFSASTDLHFRLKLDVGPIKAPKTSINLGTIHVDESFVGHLDLSINTAGLKGSVSGHFGSYSLPAIALDIHTSSLKQIPKRVENQVQTFAQDIFADILGDASKWANAVKSGVITDADDAGKVLTGFFGKSQSEAEALLKKFSLHGSATVHIDTISPHFDVNSTHADSSATHVDQSSPHIDSPRRHIDTSTPHVDGSKWGIHGDAGGHVDKTITPHGDSTPHLDTSTPHFDTGTPHADSTPHVDQSQHVDV